MKDVYRNLLLMTVAPFALSGVAMAQTSPAPAAARTEDGITDIVVTAQRRSEKLQDVPVSITALSGVQLTKAGALSTVDLTNLTPGLVWGRSTANSQPTIRGIGTRNASIGDEPNVAVYLDGVYQPEQFTTIMELANIERVEVLKGPQGTLFGRNATGGAINIITKKPSFSPEGDFNLSYGRFGYYKATGYLTGAIVEDKIAASITAIKLGDDGYIHNVFLGGMQGWRRSTAVRGKLLFQLSPSVSLLTTALYSVGDANDTFSHHPLNGNTNARTNAAAGNYPLNILIPQGDYETATQFVPNTHAKQDAFDARLTADIGETTLSVLGAYQHNYADVLSEADGSPIPISFNEDFRKTRAYIAEAVLTSRGASRFQWTLGANAFFAKSAQLPFNSNGTFINDYQKTRSASAFGEATYEVVDRLFLTGGVRYTYDRKESFFQSLGTAAVPNISAVSAASTKSNNLSPRAVIRYKFSDSSNVYASFSRGFKSATFNPGTAFGAVNAAKPEKVDAFEVGLKSDLSRFVRFNGAAFYYRYQDLQVSGTALNSGGGIISFLQNADLATIYGLEANLQARPTRSLTLGAGLSYLHTRINDFPNASVTVPIIPTTGVAAGLPSGNSTVSRNVSGNRLIRAPKLTLTLSADYTVPLGDMGSLTFAANALISSRFYTDVLNRLYQPSYKLVNGSVTWRAPGDHLSLSVFMQNVTNDRVIAQIFTSALNDIVAYQKPRWVGVTAGYKF